MYKSLKDKNGKILVTGQIVKVTGTYFKTDSGYFIVRHSPNDPSWNGSYCSLHKCNKKGVPSKAKYNLSSFPLSYFTSNREKNRLAKEHDQVNASIEIVGEVKTFKIQVTDRRYNRSNTIIVLEEEYNKYMDEADHMLEVELVQDFEW